MMSKINNYLSVIFLGALYLFALPDLAVCQARTENRTEWFSDARFGMFIHWGVYSAAEGVWKGEALRHSNNYAEWIKYRNVIDREEYSSLLSRFRWDKIRPEEWVLLAKNAGMKYMVITAKHHDGFAIWDSKTGTYDIGEYTNPRRDIIRELAEACKKHGLKLGFYYSHWVDWEHPFGWDHSKEITGISAADYDMYWQQKVIPQLRELLTDYGTVSVLWFDMWIHHSRTVVTKEQLTQVKKLIRETQPSCLINSRLGLSLQEDNDVDFEELGDNEFGDRPRDFLWQSPATVADSWGYNRNDVMYKSTSFLLHSLLKNVSLNGNLLLNIGPRADGNVPWEISERLNEIGAWLRVNGEAVYGCGPAPFRTQISGTGCITAKTAGGGTKMFINLFSYPLDRQLVVTGITTKPSAVYLLSDKKRKNLVTTNQGPFIKISLPDREPDKYASVVVMEFSQRPEVIEDLLPESEEGAFSFTPFNALSGVNAGDILPSSRMGTVPSSLTISGKTILRWKIYIEKEGNKAVDISYSCQNNRSEGEITVRCGSRVLASAVLPTGKTVGEPGEDWIIDRFSCLHLGELYFDKPGYYDIEMELSPPEKVPVRFQWLWAK